MYDDYAKSPSYLGARYNRYNNNDDDSCFSLEMGRSIPHPLSKTKVGYKETETLSDVDYFKMDDLFRKDRDEFLNHKKAMHNEHRNTDNSHEDDFTMKFRDHAFKIIEDLPDSASSKYGSMLTDLLNDFIQEHLELKSKYELLKKESLNDNSRTSSKVEEENKLVIAKLTEKLKKYKKQNQDLLDKIEVQHETIENLRESNRVLNDNLVRSETKHEFRPESRPAPRPRSKNEHKQEPELDQFEESDTPYEPDYSLLIKEIKTAMSQIELEEELRLKKELQLKQYRVLKQQLDELNDEKRRKNQSVMNRDLDRFKVELKSEISDILHGINTRSNDNEKEELIPVSQPRSSNTLNHNHSENELFMKLKSLFQNELNMTKSELESKFETLLSNKVGRDELEFLLFKSDISKAEKLQKTMSILQKDESEHKEKYANCPHCSAKDNSLESKYNLKNEVNGLVDRLKLISNEISRLENYEELDETELLRLISEKHAVAKKLKQKKREMTSDGHDHVHGRLHDDDDDEYEPEITDTHTRDDSDNCHTINILRDNAKKFGIPLKKGSPF